MAEDWNVAIFQATEIEDMEMVLGKLDKSSASVTDKQGKSLLHYAARCGQNYVIVKLAQDLGCNVDVVDSDGSTPLHEAARSGRADTIYQLLEFEPDTSVVAGIFGTPLHQAAQLGNQAAVEALLSAGASLDSVTVTDATVLHFAALGDNDEVITDIVKRRPDLLDREDDSGLTPLHYAAAEGSEDAVRCLHDLGANLLIGAEESSSGTPLHQAVGTGQYIVGEFLLTKGCPVDVTDCDGATSLHWAAARGNIDIITQLAHKWKCKVNAQKKNECTALHLAAMIGSEGTIQLLLKLGACNTIVAGSTGTPLHCAASAGHYESCLALLEGHPPHVVNSLGRTPLHSAALQGHTVLIALFISNGFDVNAKDTDGCTPMHLAAANGHTDAVIELIEHRAILSMVAGKLGTPLHQAALQGHAETAQRMVDRGCRLDVMSSVGSSALHYAAEGGHVEVMRLLADKGCDVNAVNEFDYTPLHYAAAYGNDDAVRELVGPLHANKTVVAGQFGAPLHRAAVNGHFESAYSLLDGHPTDLADSTGCTPLHKAVQGGHTALIHLLHGQGHDINAADNQGLRPLHYVAISGNVDTLQEVIGRNAALNPVAGKHGTPLHQAVLKGHEDCALALMDNDDCLLDLPSSDGLRVLHFAAQGGHASLLLKLVLDRQCDVQAVDKDQFTPLHTAAAHGHEKAVLELIDLGSDMNAEADPCGTPIHVAALFGHVQVLKGLSDRGFSLSRKSSNGSTVLHFAASGGHIEAVQYLIEQGCNVNAKNNDGSTALDLAQLNGKQEAADALIAAGAEPGGGSTDLEQQSSMQHEAAQVPTYAPNVFRVDEASSSSSDSDDSDDGSPERIRKLAKLGVRGLSLAADATLEFGDSVFAFFGSKLQKLKEKKERDQTRSLKAARHPEQLQGPSYEECKVVQIAGNEVETFENDPVLSQPVQSSVGPEYQCLFRRFISRNAARIGRAILETLGLPYETIEACYGRYPQNEEEAVQAGLQKWLDRGGEHCTWKALVCAMRFAGIGVHHRKMLTQELSQKMKGSN